MGWALLALWVVALCIGALARICAASRAPTWTAPLHIVGAWLTANLLGEVAIDLRLRTCTR
jgi:hypothetical protein